MSGGLTDDGFQIVDVPAGTFAPVLQTGGWFGSGEQIERCVADDCHVLRPVTGPEPCEVFAKDHVQHPVQAVLHPPVRPHDPREGQSTESERTQIITCLVLDLPFRSTSVSIRPIMARSGNTGSPG